MMLKAAACALLACFAVTEAVAGQVRAPTASNYLLDDFVIRPPRAIPNSRGLAGQSAMMLRAPLPRARPLAATAEPANARLSVSASPAQPVRAPQADGGATAAPGFPPVVTLE